MKKFSKIQKIFSSKKIKFNYYIILIFLLFSMPFVLATSTFDYEEPTITIKIYNTSIMPNLTSDITIKIEVINKQFNKNIQNITFSIFNGTAISKDTNIEFLFLTSDTAENIDFAIDYYACVAEKASINTGFTTCAKERDVCLEEYEGENATTNKEALDACNLRTQQKDVEIQGQLTTIGNLEEEEESTGNVKYIWGIVSGIIGVMGALLYCGKIGKGSVKEKSDSEFNKSQQG